MSSSSVQINCRDQKHRPKSKQRAQQLHRSNAHLKLRKLNDGTAPAAARLSADPTGLPKLFNHAAGQPVCRRVFCTDSLRNYYSQLVNLPSRINERSIATWSYLENIDLNRVPQVIHEASCHTSHSCRMLDSDFGLETIPVSLRMPVLRKNANCLPKISYYLDFELITIACLCATSRNTE